MPVHEMVLQFNLKGREDHTCRISHCVYMHVYMYNTFELFCEKQKYFIFFSIAAALNSKTLPLTNVRRNEERTSFFQKYDKFTHNNTQLNTIKINIIMREIIRNNYYFFFCFVVFLFFIYIIFKNSTYLHLNDYL